MSFAPALPASALASVTAHKRLWQITRWITLACVLTSPVWIWALLFSAMQDAYLPSLVFVPLISIACFIAFVPVWRGNPHLKELLRAGMLARLAASSLYIWMGVAIYGYSVDAFHYCTVGWQRAQDFSVVGWSAFSPPYWNTNLINNICGFVMLATGNTLSGLFALFSFAALWGGYFFYRAFCIAFPEGDRTTFGMLAILLPSNLFWSSAIGKDALAQLFIGLSAYGFARLCNNINPRSIAICAAGVLGVLATRPHVAAMLAVGMLLPFALGKSRGGWMQRGAKIVLVPVLLAVSLWIVSQAGQFLGLENGDSQSGVDKVELLTKSTQIGGSAFNAGESLPVRVAQAPFLMFRPFPWEINNGMAALASLEAVFLLWLAWKRRKIFRSALRRWREPFVGFVIIYAILFSVAFAAATSNFGILVRERIMMIPVLLMLFCSSAALPVTGKLHIPRVIRMPTTRTAAGDGAW